MSAFYDQASLVMVPSGYKDGKLYSQKPLSTSGELAFSRGSDIEATRVGGDGYIQKAQVNLLTYSSEFTNAAWKKNAGGVTAEASELDPNGQTGTVYRFSTTAGNLYQDTQSTGALYSISFYVKSGGGGNDTFRLRLGGSESALLTATSSWVRYEFYGVPTSAVYGIRTDGGGTTDILIAFAQLNYGLVAQTYVETTTAAVVSGITDDMPRLNYDFSNPTCPSLLLEPSRSNACTFTEYNPSSGFTLGANLTWNGFVESPEGVANASRFTSSAPTAAFIQTTVTIPAGDFTFSMYVRGITGPFNKTSFYIPTVGSVPMNENMVEGEGWKRVYGTGNNSGSAVSRTVTLPFYDQPAGSVFEVYGFQLESGSYSSSLIPTYGSSATRTADACSKTGISSLIGQTEGTLFAEMAFARNKGASSPFKVDRISLSDGTDTNRLFIGNTTTANEIQAFVRNATGISFNETVSVADITSTNKIALKYKANDFALWINGVEVASSTSLSYIPANLSNFQFAGASSLTVYAYEGTADQVILFPTALTDAQLAELTSL